MGKEVDAFKFKNFLKCIREWFLRIFPRPGKWWDYAIYVFIVLAFLSTYDALNNWMISIFGVYCSTIASYIDSNKCFLWLIVLFLVVWTIYVCIRKCKDYYRSIFQFLLIVFALIVLTVSTDYWNYLVIAQGFTFFHLFFLILTAFAVTTLIIPRGNNLSKTDEVVKKKFTVDNVKATLGKADKNRIAYANNLVKRILNTDISTEALSVGISGEWGSGKSTFLEILKSAFQEDKTGRVSAVVDFHPWDGASSGQIISDFFNVLVRALGEKYSVVKDPLLKYAELLTVMNAQKSAIYLAGILDKRRKRSFSETKSLISKYLKQYGKIIPVLIDDLDRLTADEIADVLMLIRNTADFPNIVYVAAYDKCYVCGQLEEHRKIENSSIYLEKFFSVELTLPKLDDQYQYDVLVEEIKAMNPDKDIIRYIETMPSVVERILCKYFQNFRQVKRFARIFMQDCEYFLQMPSATKTIELNDLFLLKMLAFVDEYTYLQLEKNSSSLVVLSKKLVGGFKPLMLRPGTLGETVDDKEKDIAYDGPILSDATKAILKVLFFIPRNGRKFTSFINPECTSIYFMLNMPSHSIPVMDVEFAIAGESDLTGLFETWMSEEKFQSLYNHLLGINPKKMDEHCAKRYLFLCLASFPYLARSSDLVEQALRPIRYSNDFYEPLNSFIHEQWPLIVNRASDNIPDGYINLMKCLTSLYPEQLEVENSGEDRTETLLGGTTEINRLAGQVFYDYTCKFTPNTDDLFKKNSLTRSIAKVAVVSFYDDGECEWLGCVSLIRDAMIEYFKAHKGKNKDLAAHYYDVGNDVPIEHEEEVAEGKRFDMAHLFGDENTYRTIVEECFD